MPAELASSLRETIDREITHLCAITDEQASAKASPRAWSNKEELGHLIDSATNNHARFVIAALEPELRGPGYKQDGWVALHGYNEWRWAEILEFWREYNYLLEKLVGRIPEDRLETPCRIGDAPPVTLRFLIEDYVLHMQHHLDHILRRDKLTVYPGAALGV